MKPDGLVYFAHAMPTYGKSEEARALGWFDGKGWTPNLVNPSDPRHQSHCCRSNMSYWKGLVRNCAALYFIRFKGQIPSGVGQEIETALENRAKVVEMVPYCDGFDLVEWTACPKYLDYEATKRLIYPERYQKVER